MAMSAFSPSYDEGEIRLCMEMETQRPATRHGKLRAISKIQCVHIMNSIVRLGIHYTGLVFSRTHSAFGPSGTW